MKITFDAALDGSGWAGPLGTSDHVFGQTWVGPLGLLGLLETRLGLGGRYEGALQRACRLSAQLRGMSGYWRPSFDVDPLGATRRLLRDRDQLRMWGWLGQPISPRLAELHTATMTASAGIPDRLQAINGALASRSTGIDALVSFTSIGRLPPAWREVFHSLRRAGVSVEERTLEPAPALGDLASARTTPFEPLGDGRLCLLRRHGPLDLADEIAACLAACDSLDRVVIIGADAVLDQALIRHGLPRSGAHIAPTASSRLMLLVLEAAFFPMEVDDLHALLTMDPGPIPRSAAVALVQALRRSPGRRTAEWKEAITKGLEHTDEARRAGVERRMTDLLMPVCGRAEALPVAATKARLETLGAWARDRAVHEPSLVEVVHQTRALLEALDLIGRPEFSRHELRRLCDDLGAVDWSWQPAQLGLAHVVRPGAILGPADAIVWWNFSRETAPRPERLVLSRAEHDGLRAAGVEPPSPALAMAIEVEGWRRPLLQARQALAFACAYTDDSGDANHPHPLWDDLTASLGDFRSAGKLERADLRHPASARTTLVPLQPLVTPAAIVTIASPLALRDVESPSSLERLLGCSLSWTLDHHAHLRAGLSAGPLAPGPLLFGILAHRFLQQILLRSADPDASASLAAALFDEQVADLCEALALPQHQAARATLKRAVVESARELVRLAAKHGTRSVTTEVAGKTTALGQAIEGRLDLVWGNPAVVLDLKWGKRAHAERLETGTAIQLAAYAAMQEIDGRYPETAYFVLQTQELLAEPGGRLAPDAHMQGAYTSPQIWSAAMSSLRRRRDELAAGRLEAPGAVVEDVEPIFSPTALQISPSCQYCSFPGLCGRGGAR